MEIVINKPQISIVVPTFNEADNIALLLVDIKQALQGFNFEVVVIDDGTDKTAEIAMRFPHTEVYSGPGQGLGEAIVSGIKYSKGEIVVVMDADNSHSPFDIPRLVKPILQYDYDMVIGSRYVKGGDISKWDKQRGRSSRISAAIMYPIFGVRDANSGFFAFKKSVVNGVKLRATSWKMMMEVLVKGNVSKKLEIPITFRDRMSGVSKNNIKQKLTPSQTHVLPGCL